MIYLIGGKITGMVIKNMDDTKEKNNDSFFSLLYDAINPHISALVESQRPLISDKHEKKQENGE